MTTSSSRDALTTTWAAQGIEPATLADLEARATIRRRNVPDAQRTLPLPALLAPVEGGVPQIQLGAAIGEGGMGVVYTAVQTSLARDVAVKILRGDDGPPGREAQLLCEARVTGRLEHPNVVPVYTLGQDEAGRPLIVMKRIEGRSWSELLAEVPPAGRASEPFLRQHLGILGQVARALHFAHTKGLLHRDVKPDNVMIGAFGEVYVVDWGIAVGLTLAPDGVPLASDVTRVEGTPVYLAPEMAAADGASLDARSDVYLLGATLHEILTGAPPHVAANVLAVLYKAYASEVPAYPPSVPAELAGIARRALARERHDRYASAAAVAEALDQFTLHRSSMELCREALRRAHELEALAGPARGEPIGPPAYALFHEARFAFEQALRGWPENAEAREGRRALLASMIGLELSRGTPSAALALLHALDEPPAELEADVRRAIEAERERLARLQAIERDADMRLGARTRQLLTYVAAATWGASCVACGMTTRAGTLVIDHLGFAAVNAGFLLGTVLAMLATRRETLATAASRRVAYTTTLVFAAGVVLWPLLGALGISMPQTTVVGAFVAALLWTTATFTLGRPWLPMVLGQLVVMLGAWQWPAYHFEIFGVIGAAQTALAGHLMVSRGAGRADTGAA